MMEKELTFLVVLDDSKEIFNALRYAAKRTARNNGRVALLYTFETLEFSHWKAVEDIAEIELREEAESKIKEYESYVLNFSEKKPKKFIMKGDRLECIISFLNANKFISNFILASSPNKSGGDPLINAFTIKHSDKIKVPITIIPPMLTEEEIDNLSWFHYFNNMFIQTEETPNPATLKFLPGKVILDEGTLDFKDKSEAGNSNLAKELFGNENVTGVFIGRDFLTVSKSAEVEWEELKPSVLSIMMDFFSSGAEIVADQANSNNLSAEKINYNKKDRQIVDKIIQLLDERIKPAVAQDGGDINFVKYTDGIVFLELRGACSGCPSSTITLKSGIENMLKYYIPEVVSVEAINQ